MSTARTDWSRFWTELSLKLYEEAPPEERARIDAARRLRSEDEARPRITVKALRTCAWNGTTKEVDIVLVVRPGHGDRRWLFIDEGGSTGFESIPFDAIPVDFSWIACMGTKQRWDRLVVPPESLRAAREALQ